MVYKHVSKPELAGKAQTVLGAISPEALGVTLPHEHLFSNAITALRDYKPGETTEQGLYYQSVTLENLWWITYHPVSNRDNLVFQDEEY